MLFCDLVKNKLASWYDDDDFFGDCDYDDDDFVHDDDDDVTDAVDASVWILYALLWAPPSKQFETFEASQIFYVIECIWSFPNILLNLVVATIVDVCVYIHKFDKLIFCFFISDGSQNIMCTTFGPSKHLMFRE